MGIRRILALILLLLPLSFAADCPIEPCVSLPTLGIDFLFVAALVSVAIVVIAYTFSNFFQSPTMNAWAKTELRELFAAVILVALLWGLTSGLNPLIKYYTGEPTFVSLGSSSLNNTITYLEDLYYKDAEAYQAIGVFQGFSVYASAGPPMGYVYLSTGTTPVYGATILMGPLSNAANNLTLQILTFRLVQTFMYYIGAVVPAFVLPLGFAFRMFPFTRNIGNTVIALSLGAILVLPLSLFLVDEFYKSVTFQYKDKFEKTSFRYENMDISSPLMDVSKVTTIAVCKDFPLRTFTELGEWFWGAIYGLVMMASCGYPPAAYPVCVVEKMLEFVFQIWPDIIGFIQLAFGLMMGIVIGVDFSKPTSISPFTTIPYILLPAVAEATAFSIVSFMMIVMVTFGGVRAISSALGGDYVLYGLSRFV